MDEDFPALVFTPIFSNRQYTKHYFSVSNLKKLAPRSRTKNQIVHHILVALHMNFTGLFIIE